jgi:DNA polymerase
MSSTNDDLNRLLNDVDRFLRQDRELYGDLFLMPPTAHDEKPRQNPGPPHTVVQEDLFGETAPVRIPEQQPRRTVILPDEPWASAGDLMQLEGMINGCLKCGLGHTRKSFVFGVGNPHADVVLIGEAPGADEDEQGEPFVGRAGQLLNKILEAIHFKREDVYICNILKCRPPNNREPELDEVNLCEPYLWKQLELIKPKLILCLGRVAGQVLLKTNESLAALRSRTHQYQGITVMVTYHPAALLRNPQWKKPVWEDVQKLRKLYDEMISAG